MRCLVNTLEIPSLLTLFSSLIIDNPPVTLTTRHSQPIYKKYYIVIYQKENTKRKGKTLVTEFPPIYLRRTFRGAGSRGSLDSAFWDPLTSRPYSRNGPHSPSRPEEETRGEGIHKGSDRLPTLLILVTRRGPLRCLLPRPRVSSPTYR